VNRYHLGCGLVNSWGQGYFYCMSTGFSASGSDLADLILYIARLGQSPGRQGAGAAQAQSLTAAQWTALRYFARANRFSRTPSAFSEFHATTRGTASQTVKSLVTLGLLSRQTHETDGRSTVIEVTTAGHEMLCHDPMAELRRALEKLEPAARAAVAEVLGQVVSDLAHSRNAPIFGSCSECSHCQTDAGGSYCHCTQSLLTLREMGTICVDFQPSRSMA
jgi:DNA-binding MarR family transcriptional regulator